MTTTQSFGVSSASPCLGSRWGAENRITTANSRSQIAAPPLGGVSLSLKKAFKKTSTSARESSSSSSSANRSAVICSSSMGTVSSAPRERSVAELNEGIADFYDASSGVWEEIWGEHMHHGFYELDGQEDSGGHRAAQVRMIEEALAWARIPEDESKPKTVVDVGCGIGGSSRHLARKYGTNVKGITLSPRQAQRATSITAEQGLSELVSFQVADALKQPFADGEFDFIWSMESGEHMPDKTKFLSELARVTAPNGRILIVTWCHRDLQPGETSLTESEQKLLQKICDAYYLPAWCSKADYVKIAEDLGLQDIRSADWSQHITPFWPAVMMSALTPKALFGLAKSGWKTIKGAVAMIWMIQGYQRGLIKFALITAQKRQ